MKGNKVDSLKRLEEVSRRLKATQSRLKKTEIIAEYLKSLPSSLLPLAISFLSGEIRGGPIAVGGAMLREAYQVPPATESTLALGEISDYFEKIRKLRGPGSIKGKIFLLRDLFRRATSEEKEFLASLIMGELRQGASLGIVKEAVTKAFSISPLKVENALMLTGDLGVVAKAAREGKIDKLGFSLFVPIKPMLASTAELEDVSQILRETSIEYKIDGARIQVHRRGEEVKIFTRHLRDVTERLPEVVELVRKFPEREFIVEGEVFALSYEGKPLPFQFLMRRLGRKKVIKEHIEKIPVRPYFFDCLYLDGDLLLLRNYEDRWAALEAVTKKEFLIPRVVKPQKVELEEFLRKSIEMGHEGIMVKKLKSPYIAGVRGKNWLKIKPKETLDLVVIEAEWGHGRRKDWLSNYLLAAREVKTGSFLPLGKTFKGLSDRELTWMTGALLKIAKYQTPHSVIVEPRIVVEVGFNEIQRSKNYSSGFALRFARILKIRTDKTPLEADTIEKVKRLYERQFRFKGKLEP